MGFDKIKISVITIVYNGERDIKRTIESVLNQSYHNVEYILVDGASTDGTMSIVERYRDKFYKIISEPDSGIYNAMNKGLKHATGDYVVFVNSSDYLYSDDILQEVSAAIQKESQLPDIIYGNYREVKEGVVKKEIPCYSHKRVWYGMFACHQSIFYRLDMLKENGICYEKYRVAADYKMTMQAVLCSKHFLKLPICVATFDVSGISNSNPNLGLREADQVRKEVLCMGWLKRKGIIVVSKNSRFLKRRLGFVYKLYRYKHGFVGLQGNKA